MTRNQFNNTRAFEIWNREFSAASMADNYAELLRPIEHLELDCSPEDVLACTISLVSAVVAHCKLDGRDCESFLKQQYSRLDADSENEYCLTFDLSGTTGRYFGRILTDSNFTSIDLEDLFNHPWPMSKTAGFTRVYITRLDGERIGEQELERLEEQVTSDMYSGYSEDELSAYVSMSDFKDTAYCRC
jgi:hypothetical protein